jgi:hypothetical protein
MERLLTGRFCTNLDRLEMADCGPAHARRQAVARRSYRPNSVSRPTEQQTFPNGLPVQEGLSTATMFGQQAQLRKISPATLLMGERLVAAGYRTMRVRRLSVRRRRNARVPFRDNQRLAFTR